MGDLNLIIGLHLALFTALFIRGGQKDSLLLCAGAWKMLIAYWGIWNHRQVSRLDLQLVTPSRDLTAYRLQIYLCRFTASALLVRGA